MSSNSTIRPRHPLNPEPLPRNKAFENSKAGHFKRRAYQKAVLGWMRALLGVGHSHYADAIWRSHPSLKETAAAFLGAGEPAIVAAAELWRRVLTDQLLRARNDDRLAVYDFVTGKRQDVPSNLAELCLSYCLELRKRGKLNDIDSGMADTYVDEVLQVALGRNSEARSASRIDRAIDAMVLGSLSPETAERLRSLGMKD